MALQFSDETIIVQNLISAWQKKLDTTDDPTNGGQWTTNSPNGNGIGLIGGLSDSCETAIADFNNKTVHPPEEIIVAHNIVDNRNGLNPTATVAEIYQSIKTVTTTHEFSNEVKVGASVEIKVKAEILGTGGEAGSTFSIDYTHNTTDSNTETSTESATNTHTVTVNPPAGKVYMVAIVGQKRVIDIPYTINLRVKGTTETWFPDRVEDHFNYFDSVGSLFGQIDGSNYTDAGNGEGLVNGAITGILTASHSTSFRSQMHDITDQVPTEGPLPNLRLDSLPMKNILKNSILVTGNGGVPHPPSFKSHVVQSGDTVLKIAEKFYSGDGTKWTLIRDANHEIDLNNLQIGQQIRIPD